MSKDTAQVVCRLKGFGQTYQGGQFGFGRVLGQKESFCVAKKQSKNLLSGYEIPTR